MVRQQAAVSSGSVASLSQSTPSMNKADVVRFELENAESRVEMCKVSNFRRYLEVCNVRCRSYFLVYFLLELRKTVYCVVYR